MRTLAAELHVSEDRGEMTGLRTFHTADLDAATLEAARALLEDVFDGEFTDHDWEHALDARMPRLETNLRLPLQLRARVDELTAGAREYLPRSERADLINATLGRGLPLEAQTAAELVAEHARQLERTAGR